MHTFYNANRVVHLHVDTTLHQSATKWLYLYLWCIFTNINGGPSWCIYMMKMKCHSDVWDPPALLNGKKHCPPCKQYAVVVVGGGLLVVAVGGGCWECGAKSNRMVINPTRMVLNPTKNQHAFGNGRWFEYLPIICTCESSQRMTLRVLGKNNVHAMK